MQYVSNSKLFHISVMVLDLDPGHMIHNGVYGVNAVSV